ncbi:MAG: nucleotidyltransferase family protein [Bacilli bacterium]|jgi:predicted nucleotidyltransferase|nr:nucleotidyltransferase family protein [Bacilli bacterium]HHU23493.1 nucleotidyltransferase family protein [Acholeplasmataceae bacterium]
MEPVVLGIVVEFNPYHLGHQYFISQAKALINPNVMIAITSTSFSMRGEIAIVDKFTKTEQMLAEGIDIVLELPCAKSVQSADFFAYHAIKTLSQMQITDLAFGVENEDIALLYQLLTIIQTPDFQKHLQIALKTYTSYKRAYTQAFEKSGTSSELIALFNQPNVTLALQYLKAIQDLKLDVKIHPLKRMGSHYHDTAITHRFASAGAIRRALRSGKDISEYVPESTLKLSFVDQALAEERLFSLLQYAMLVKNPNYGEFFGLSEGIENYLRQHLRNATSYSDFLERIKNKRYSISKCQRIFFYLLWELPKKFDQFHPYLRILGFTVRGEKYLNTLPKETKGEILTSLKHSKNPIGLIELKATQLYEILTQKQGLTQKEFLIPLKRKD